MKTAAQQNPTPDKPGSRTANTAQLDTLTQRHTAFATLDAMLNAGGNYFPSLNTRNAGACYIARENGTIETLTAKQRRAELATLADAYDAAQAARGDSRRAYRS